MPFPSNPSANNEDFKLELFNAQKALFVGAHPDDIEFYCGGTVYMMRKKGVDVVFAIATRGGKGKKGAALNKMECLRTQHSHDAAAMLGGARVVLFDYPDKRLAQYIEQFAKDLQDLYEKEKPDILLSWDPDFIYNPHPDHVAAAAAVRKANLPVRHCFYGTYNPNFWIGFDEKTFNVKLNSIWAHKTETPFPYSIYVKRILKKKLSLEGKKVGAEYAEWFRRE